MRCLKHIYAPWRSKYITGHRDAECVFCDIAANGDRDAQNQLLFRDRLCFGVMNKYPYSPGHFMIIPYTHVENLEELPKDVWLRMNEIAIDGVKLLKRNVRAEGVNIGINLGNAAGAGIAEHLHLHLVPRRTKEMNFITTIAETRVFSVNFEEIYMTLKEGFDAIYRP